MSGWRWQPAIVLLLGWMWPAAAAAVPSEDAALTIQIQAMGLEVTLTASLCEDHLEAAPPQITGATLTWAGRALLRLRHQMLRALGLARTAPREPLRDPPALLPPRQPQPGQDHPSRLGET